ncbi:efflux RND transporter periplasmic adaptor subunit [Thalassotalea agariperforans]
MNKQNNALGKIIIPAIIVIVTAILMKVIFDNPPENNRSKPSKAPQMTVATTTLEPKNYQVMVQSFGTVEPRTQSVLFAQVSGQINQVSPEFRAGGFFEKGDVLVQLDDRDHRAEVKIAQASLVSAKQALQEEEARVAQAEADWQRLGNGKAPSDLVLRKPQLAAAQAKVLSAEAQLDKVKLALERTRIVAPYAGRILKKHVDIGQVVSSNTALADIYAADYVEIRLPIKNKDLALMKLPEEYLTEPKHQQGNNDVMIYSDLIGKQQWQGRIIRTESAIDQSSQQLYVVAQINRPYDKNENNNGQIKIGQYVTAEITGRNIDNALVIPSSAIYQGSYVYVVEQGVLKRKDIKLGWQNGTEAIVANGLNAGDELVLTSLGQVNSGTPVAIEGQVAQRGQSSQQMPKQRREKLEKMAAEKGVSVEVLLAERRKMNGDKPERKAPQDKVNN